MDQTWSSHQESVVWAETDKEGAAGQAPVYSELKWKQ